MLYLLPGKFIIHQKNLADYHLLKPRLFPTSLIQAENGFTCNSVERLRLGTGEIISEKVNLLVVSQ